MHGSPRSEPCDQPAGRRHLAVPPPARREPRRLVGVGGRRVRGGARAQRPGAAERRVRRVPLVPRDGPRVLRGRADRGVHERALRQHQGRPRGAAGRGRGLHGRHPGDDRARRLADDLRARPRGDAVLRGDLLPGPAAARQPELPAGARGAGRGVARPGRRGAAGRRRDPRAPARPGRPRERRHRSGDARRRGDHAGPRVRPDVRRLRRRPEVPAVDGARVPAAPPRPDRRPADPAAAGRDLRGDGPRRHLRPDRRRLRALLGRRRLGGAALREDALRQRAAARRLRPLGRPPDRRGDRRLPAPRAAHARGWLRLRAGRRHRGRRGEVLRVDPGPARRGARRGRRCLGRGDVHRHRGRHLRARRLHAPAEAGPHRPAPAGGRQASGCARPASSAPARPATTRWSRPGTGSRSAACVPPAP